MTDWDRYDHAIALREAGRHQEALVELRSLASTSEDPEENAVVQMAIARCLRACGKLGEARRALRDAYPSLSTQSSAYLRVKFVEALIEEGEAFAYCAFFGLPVPNIPEAPELDSDALTAIRKREAKRAAEKAEQTKRERAEALVRQQELIVEWRAGQYSGCLYDVPAMLRIAGDEVQTSRGARFPVTHAKRGLAVVRKVRESGQPYVRNGHTIHLGPYAIDRIEQDGTVKAGCHVVSWEEIERIAPLLDSTLTLVAAVDSTSEVL